MEVLIVDDEPLIRRSLRRAFELNGHRVTEAEDGVIGLQQWQAKDPDLVILDVLMPGLTGPQVLSQMEGKASRAKVILISAYSGEYDLKKVQSMGAALFIPKPFTNVFNFVKIALDLFVKS